MEANLPPEAQFSEAVAHFYSLLKKAYLDQVKKAIDKDYAKDFCRRVLFEENKWIPQYSVFYTELVARYSHHYRLGDTNAVEITLSFLPQIRQLALDVVERAKNIRESLNVLYHELHWLYQEAIEDNKYSLLELIDQEEHLIQANEDRIIKLLGLHHATQQLLDEFSDEPEEQDASAIDFATNEPNSVNQHLTQSQQVLVTYYISQALGIKHKKNVSKCTRALFAFLRISTSPINSDAYKKLLHPLESSPLQTTLANLKVVRGFFEPLEVAAVIKHIDDDIERLSNRDSDHQKSIF
jgi:hypothetical protein